MFEVSMGDLVVAIKAIAPFGRHTSLIADPNPDENGKFTKKIFPPGDVQALSMIRARVVDDKLYLAAANGEVGIERWIRVTKSDGDNRDVLIPNYGNMLVELVQRLDHATPVRFTVSDTYEIVIKSTNKTTLKGLPVDDFPTVFAFDDSLLSFTLGEAKLRNALSSVRDCISSNGSRPVLNGALLDLTDKRILFVGTDGFRMGVKRIDLPESPVEFATSTILPKTAVDRLIGLLGQGSDSDVKVAIDNKRGHIKAKGSSWTVTFIGINGTFPDYTKILPKEKYPNSAEVELKPFLAALRTARVMAHTETNNALKIGHAEDETVIQLETLESEDGCHEDTFPIEGKMAKKLAVNIDLLWEIVESITNEKIAIEMADAGEESPVRQPVVIKPVGDNSLTYLLMPLAF